MAHNSQVQTTIETPQADAVSSMSVLNVIPESAVRLAHIATLKSALTIGGNAYFKIWQSEAPLL